MFAFQYPVTGDYITVYFDMQNYYFYYNEIEKLLDSDSNRIKSSSKRRLVRKFKTAKFLLLADALLLLDCYTNTKPVKKFFKNSLLPVLRGYQKSYKKTL
ncbi:asb130 [Agrotis segetum nucleopolyhedrovirus B]|uniref:Asb130 n=1 Tax=Agrotis segetum nucleopolyhedrovirus B TaxID=1580580 RepID=A0A0A7KRJ4_9ABAC|nr:asb130 [Agrotis segetum nucleopolyhedrovirus B]AIZ48687.1 asb130 [Agrotis segetum nucleopolyhedrovirus B]